MADHRKSDEVILKGGVDAPHDDSDVVGVENRLWGPKQVIGASRPDSAKFADTLVLQFESCTGDTTIRNLEKETTEPDNRRLCVRGVS